MQSEDFRAFSTGKKPLHLGHRKSNSGLPTLMSNNTASPAHDSSARHSRIDSLSLTTSRFLAPTHSLDSSRVKSFTDRLRNIDAVRRMSQEGSLDHRETRAEHSHDHHDTRTKASKSFDAHNKITCIKNSTLH